ncbi:hypothetical protein PG997_014422 [Apiospora hydei]|uniref:Uncharacterized protein n=1 Tax=Apiospora hydei TaxID=1337664 RepID=A0ABR1UTS4_9PEZI
MGGGFGGGGMGRSPYGRPFGPYNRPMGMGYGGGMGMMPMALPLFGGMALGAAKFLVFLFRGLVIAAKFLIAELKI